MLFLLAAAAVVVAAPIIAALLVTVASLREDSARTLAGRPPGRIASAARRLLYLHTQADARVEHDVGLTPADMDLLRQGFTQIPRPRSATDSESTLTLPRS
jgi:hypothetical protein